jgi:hypothetical protein
MTPRPAVPSPDRLPKGLLRCGSLNSLAKSWVLARMPTHKTLRSVAHNTAHSFLSVSGLHYLENSWPIQHLLMAARAASVDEAEIDLLTGEVQPASIANEVIRKAANGARAHFLDMLEASNSSAQFVTAAKLRVAFRFAEKLPGRPSGHIFGAGVIVPEMVPYSAQVTLVDDHGRQYKTAVPEWWRT